MLIWMALTVAAVTVTVKVLTAFGVALGFTMQFAFAAVRAAGEYIGLQMGLNFAGFFDPTTNSQSSSAGRFFGNLAMMLFVVLNGHLMLIQAVNASFSTFPIGGDPLASLQALRLHELGAIIFTYGLWIALPMIGMLLFINVALGIISRIAPQMNVFAIGFPLTLSAGLIGIAVTVPMLEEPVARLMRVVSEIFI